MQFLDDKVGVGGPDEGFGFVCAEVAVDRGLQVDQQAEGAALQAAAGERGEEGLTELAQEHEVGPAFATALARLAGTRR